MREGGMMPQSYQLRLPLTGEKGVNEVEKLIVQLVEKCEEIYGRAPERILIRPNRDVEVNCQVWLRGDRDPQVVFVRR
jgi:hypothetical protein